MRAGNVRGRLRAGGRIDLSRIGIDAVRRRKETAGHQAVYPSHACNLIQRIHPRRKYPGIPQLGERRLAAPVAGPAYPARLVRESVLAPTLRESFLACFTLIPHRGYGKGFPS